MKKYRVILTESEQEELRGVMKRRSVKSSMYRRAELLLAVADNVLGMSDEEAGRCYHVSTDTIERLRKRCCEGGVMMALEGKKRQYSPVKLTGEVEAGLTRLACSSPPEGHERWTLRLLADRLVELELVDSVSPTSVMKLMKKTSSSHGKRRCG